MDENRTGVCIIDRFEEELAVVEFEGRFTFDLPRSLLPEDAAEGDVLRMNITIDQAETKRRQELADAMLRAIMKTDE
ncbi:hypothetical protein CBW65_01785 [Tumebacillus avium]|uniref:DUF3006 domain-containing protein n=1 Tax=Tumebacillus avium TaxID=1903704 RepID=A0A1Y0IHK9_9BACL|nr:DUF3006 domain-containing protein [Tumebacillus avium]ARU59927.1 hypothetical protein CBW65_01785 [Tumebacillus avium]